MSTQIFWNDIDLDFQPLFATKNCIFYVLTFICYINCYHVSVNEVGLPPPARREGGPVNFPAGCTPVWLGGPLFFFYWLPVNNLLDHGVKISIVFVKSNLLLLIYTFFSEKNYSIFSVLRIDWLLVKFIGTYILWWRIKSSLPVLLYKKRSQRYQNWK